MIKNSANDRENFETKLKNNEFLCRKIMADYISCAGVQDSNMFYTTDKGIFMLSGVNITLCGEITDENLEEIISFAGFCGAKTIETQLELPLETEKQMYIMEYKSDCKEITDIKFERNNDIYSFIKFCCENFVGISFDIAYANFARKVNKGISNVYYVKENKQIISGAIDTKYGEDSVYITFVCTDVNYRNKSLAKKVINHIICQNKNKKILLKCEEKLKNYYENMGFSHTGTINIYKV